MVEEEGKFYTVMETFWNKGAEGESGGTDKKQSWYAYGKSLIENKDRVLASYLTKEESRITEVLSRLDTGEERSESAERAIRQLRQELTIIREAQEEMGLR